MNYSMLTWHHGRDNKQTVLFRIGMPLHNYCLIVSISARYRTLAVWLSIHQCCHSVWGPVST